MPAKPRSPLRNRAQRKPRAKSSYFELLDAHREAALAGHPLLTDAGVRYVNSIASAAHKHPPGAEVFTRPFWDAELKRLWLGRRLLKEFRQPAVNQIAILEGFQRRGWPQRIADPMPAFFGNDQVAAKQRLHDTVKSLNRGLPKGTIRFRGDGSGKGIRWEAINGRSAS